MMLAKDHAFRLGVFVAILLFNMIRGSPAAAQTPAKVEARTITLGIVSEINQKEIEAHFQDFVRYLARKLSSTSKIEGRIVFAPTQSRLSNLLTERKVDFYMESPYPTHMINNVYGSGKLLLRRWKGGMADYHASIFTNRNGPTKSLDDLKGKIIVFEDRRIDFGLFPAEIISYEKGIHTFAEDRN